jgi:hypothetical protein
MQISTVLTKIQEEDQSPVEDYDQANEEEEEDDEERLP